jgi:glucose/arabinose dehydrogenase
VRIWDGRALRPQPFLDIADRVLAGGERGLFGVAFHPRHADNGRLFVHYTDRRGDTVLARLEVLPADRDRADPSSFVVLLQVAQPFANHNGGQIAFGPDGYLYLGLGDGGAGGDPFCNAQRGDSLLGKILRLDVDAHDQSPPFYGIPPDNPFAGPGGFADEVWALGLRNPWRFSFDRANGDLFIADVGQGSREEIDLQPAGQGGRNYGWNSEEGSLCFAAAPCPEAPPCGHPSLVRPIVEYGHGGGDCSVTGGYVYRGRLFPALAGAYFYGDFCSGRLWLARRRGGAWEEELLAPRLPQLTSFGEDRDGELYLATLRGEVWRLLGPAAGPPRPPPIERPGGLRRFVRP